MSVTLAKFDAPGQYGIGPTIDDVPNITAAKDKAMARYRDLALVSLTLPGMPYLYYGEELGLVGRRYMNDDIGRRDAMPWGDDDPAGDTVTWTKASGKLEGGQNKSTPTWADQDGDPTSLLTWYRTLGNLRKDHPALKTLNFTACPWPGANTGTVLAYFRQGNGENLLVTVNLGWDPVVVTAPAGTKVTVVTSLAPQKGTEGDLTLAAGQAVVWKVTP
jgi:glycosidase